MMLRIFPLLPEAFSGDSELGWQAPLPSRQLTHPAEKGSGPGTKNVDGPALAFRNRTQGLGVTDGDSIGSNRRNTCNGDSAKEAGQEEADQEDTGTLMKFRTGNLAYWPISILLTHRQELSLEVPPPLMFPMTDTPLGRDQNCSLKNRSWILEVGTRPPQLDCTSSPLESVPCP
ncbi:hypothetical protein STEG23_003394, partial [Scotinomys teguina]